MSEMLQLNITVLRPTCRHYVKKRSSHPPTTRAQRPYEAAGHHGLLLWKETKGEIAVYAVCRDQLEKQPVGQANEVT